jgi:NTP pyrophosphatase (non-canonical NTP hydrolase)
MKLDKAVGRLFEEMSELQFEICKHYFRNKTNKLIIAHEVADVLFSLEDIVKILDIEKEVMFAKQELDEAKINGVEYK